MYVLHVPPPPPSSSSQFDVDDVKQVSSPHTVIVVADITVLVNY